MLASLIFCPVPMVDEPSVARPRRTFEEIAESIRNEIASGMLKPGDKLPPERVLAANLAVSRTAVREALRDLEGKGILKLVHGRSGGAFVLRPSASRVTHAIGDMVDIGSITLSELTEARSLLMGLVVDLAVQRATDVDFEALERNIEEAERYTSEGLFDKRIDALTHFYALLGESTQNALIILFTNSMTSIVRRYLGAVHNLKGGYVEDAISARRRLVTHLRDRDAKRAHAELNSQLLKVHRLLAEEQESTLKKLTIQQPTLQSQR